VSEEVRLPEASFFHKASRTLLVTDAVVYVDRDPPDVIPTQVGRGDTYWHTPRHGTAQHSST